MKYVYSIIATIAFAIGFFVLTFVSTLPRSEFNDGLREETCVFQGAFIEERVCIFRPDRNGFRTERLPCFAGIQIITYFDNNENPINGSVQITNENFSRLDTEEELQEAIGDLRPGDFVDCYINPQMEITTPMSTAGFIAGSVVLGVFMCCACCCSCWFISTETDLVSDAIEKLEEWASKLFASNNKKDGEERRPQEESEDI